MTGVEILASSEVLVSGGFDTTSFIIGMLLFVVISFVTGAVISCITCKDDWILICTLIGLVPAWMFGMVFGYASAESEEYEIHYKVLISDEVSMNEFLEEYEIIDQEGKIYTVKEKVNNDG